MSSIVCKRFRSATITGSICSPRCNCLLIIASRRQMRSKSHSSIGLIFDVFSIISLCICSVFIKETSNVSVIQ